MSFQQPLLLLALLAVPLAAAAYVIAERRRRRRAHAFASPATAASVVPRRPGFRRHVPPALGLLALAGLLAALARPQVSVAVPAEQASIVLAMDHSGSMQATDVAPSRLEATVAAGERFLEEVPDRVRVGGVVFDHRAEAVRRRRATARRCAWRCGGDAALAAAPRPATRSRPRWRCCRRGAPRTQAPPAAVVLLSDGKSTHGRDPLPVADRARGWACPSTPSRSGRAPARSRTASACRPTPRRCARSPSAPAGARSPPSEAGALREVYKRLGSQVATEREDREITAMFAGGALALLVGGSGLSLLWFRRLV